MLSYHIEFLLNKYGKSFLRFLIFIISVSILKGNQVGDVNKWNKHVKVVLKLLYIQSDSSELNFDSELSIYIFTDNLQCIAFCTIMSIRLQRVLIGALWTKSHLVLVYHGSPSGNAAEYISFTIFPTPPLNHFLPGS